jgi:hypothetical protein
MSSPPTGPPRDELADLLAPILRMDLAEYGDRWPGGPDLELTMEFRRADELPEWWPTTDDLRTHDGLARYGRGSWRSERERRAVLLEQLRTALRARGRATSVPRTAAERRAVVDALRIVYAGLIGGATGVLDG